MNGVSDFCRRDATSALRIDLHESRRSPNRMPSIRAAVLPTKVADYIRKRRTASKVPSTRFLTVFALENYIGERSPTISPPFPHIRETSRTFPRAFPHIRNTSGNIPGALPHIRDTSGNIPGALPHIRDTPGNIPGALPHIRDTSGNIPGALPHTGDTSGNIPGALPHTGDTSGNSPGPLSDTVGRSEKHLFATKSTPQQSKIDFPPSPSTMGETLSQNL